MQDNMFKNPNWQEADQLVDFLKVARFSLNGPGASRF